MSAVSTHLCGLLEAPPNRIDSITRSTTRCIRSIAEVVVNQLFITNKRKMPDISESLAHGSEPALKKMKTGSCISAFTPTQTYLSSKSTDIPRSQRSDEVNDNSDSFSLTHANMSVLEQSRQRLADAIALSVVNNLKKVSSSETLTKSKSVQTGHSSFDHSKNPTLLTSSSSLCNSGTVSSFQHRNCIQSKKSSQTRTVPIFPKPVSSQLGVNQTTLLESTRLMLSNQPIFLPVQPPPPTLFRFSIHDKPVFPVNCSPSIYHYFWFQFPYHPLLLLPQILILVGLIKLLHQLIPVPFPHL